MRWKKGTEEKLKKQQSERRVNSRYAIIERDAMEKVARELRRCK